MELLAGREVMAVGAGMRVGEVEGVGAAVEVDVDGDAGAGGMEDVEVWIFTVWNFGLVVVELGGEVFDVTVPVDVPAETVTTSEIEEVVSRVVKVKRGPRPVVSAAAEMEMVLVSGGRKPALVREADEFAVTRVAAKELEAWDEGMTLDEVGRGEDVDEEDGVKDMVLRLEVRVSPA